MLLTGIDGDRPSPALSELYPLGSALIRWFEVQTHHNLQG